MLLGATPDVAVSRRAGDALARARDGAASTVARGSTVFDTGGAWWWTWAVARANATLAAAMPDVVDARSRCDNDRLRLRGEVGVAELRAAVVAVGVPAAGCPTSTRRRCGG